MLAHFFNLSAVGAEAGESLKDPGQPELSPRSVRHTAKPSQPDRGRTKTPSQKLSSLVPVCGDLNKDGPHRLIHVNAWSPVGGTI